MYNKNRKTYVYKNVARLIFAKVLKMIVLANLFAKKIKQTGEKLAYFRKKHKNN